MNEPDIPHQRRSLPHVLDQLCVKASSRRVVPKPPPTPRACSHRWSSSMACRLSVAFTSVDVSGLEVAGGRSRSAGDTSPGWNRSSSPCVEMEGPSTTAGGGMKMRWWRLLSVPVALVLVVAGGCAVGGGRDASTRSTATVVVPPATTAASARVGGPLVGVISGDSLATELARLDPRTLRPLPEGG